MQSPLVGVVTTTPETGKQCLSIPVTVFYCLTEDHKTFVGNCQILSFIFQSWRVSRMSVTFFRKEIFVYWFFSELTDKVMIFY